MRKKRSAAPMEETIPSIVPKSSPAKQRIKLEHLKTVLPLTDNQKFAFQEHTQGQHLMLHGCAGTGKSYVAIYLAIKDILTKSTPQDKLIIVKSAVQSRDIGFTKGTKIEKESEYVTPYISIFKNLFPNIENAYQQLVDQNLIEFRTTSFMRGETFDNTIVIYDEFQTATWEELSMVACRLGIDSRIIFAGDTEQNDLKRGEKSGLEPLTKIVDHMDTFTHIEFGIEDIVRSGFVKQFLTVKTKLGL